MVGAAKIVEYRADDAKLTIEILKEAEKQGAVVINYAKAIEFIKSDGSISGVHIQDQLSGRKVTIQGHTFVNATGAWVDQLREKDNSLDQRQMQVTKGINIVFSRSVFPIKHSVYFNGKHGQMIMVIPHGEKTYIGITNTPYKEALETPIVTVRDQEILLDEINSVFPKLKLKLEDIEDGCKFSFYQAGSKIK